MKRPALGVFLWQLLGIRQGIAKRCCREGGWRCERDQRCKSWKEFHRYCSFDT